MLQALVGPRGERRDHDETWLVLFDLYRAIGQQTKFETVTMEYVERFHRSAPQWFSLPKQLAESTKKPEGGGKNIAGGIGWVCPPNLDGDAVSRLDALSMQLPSPWVMDWTALETIDVESETASKPFRFPVQWVNRPNLDFRGFSGTVVSGTVKPGDKIVVAASGKESKVARIVTYDGDLKQARAGDALTFMCELGPPPYAITAPDGRELTNRWDEAQRMRDIARGLWREVTGL